MVFVLNEFFLIFRKHFRSLFGFVYGFLFLSGTLFREINHINVDGEMTCPFHVWCLLTVCGIRARWHSRFAFWEIVGWNTWSSAAESLIWFMELITPHCLQVWPLVCWITNKMTWSARNQDVWKKLSAALVCCLLVQSRLRCSLQQEQLSILFPAEMFTC